MHKCNYQLEQVVHVTWRVGRFNCLIWRSIWQIWSWARVLGQWRAACVARSSRTCNRRMRHSRACLSVRFIVCSLVHGTVWGSCVSDCRPLVRTLCVVLVLVSVRSLPLRRLVFFWCSCWPSGPFCCFSCCLLYYLLVSQEAQLSIFYNLQMSSF